MSTGHSHQQALAALSGWIQSVISHFHTHQSLFFVCAARYMRNDLSRLQIRCVNAGQGCEVVCSLESLHTHEDECEFAFVACSNTGTITEMNLN